MNAKTKSKDIKKSELPKNRRLRNEILALNKVCFHMGAILTSLRIFSSAWRLSLGFDYTTSRLNQTLHFPLK